ncbi:MAG TPA: hypothetical protein VI072_04470 [Polyangiaceae bacterium]
MARHSSTAPARRDLARLRIRPSLRRPKPLLASEALCDELAPLEPARRAVRAWLVGVTLTLACLGLAFRLGVGPTALRLDAATLSFSSAGALLAVALLPFPYALRAGVAALLGAALMALGLRGAGPLAGLAIDGGTARVLLRLLALCALPAALLFRAHYRAYRPARWVLAAALALALPFAAAEVQLLLDDSVAAVTRVAAVASVLSISCGLLGFMGDGSTGAGSVGASLVLLTLSAELGVRELTPLASMDIGLLTYAATSVGVASASVLASVGIFQLLAAALAADARRLAKKAQGPGAAVLEEPRSLS